MTQPDPDLRSLTDELASLRAIDDQAARVQRVLTKAGELLAVNRGLTREELIAIRWELIAGQAALSTGLTHLIRAYSAAREQIPDNVVIVVEAPKENP